MTILLPGDYILELTSSRPMDESTLTSVLENAGFNRLVFDTPAEGSLKGKPIPRGPVARNPMQGRQSAPQRPLAAPQGPPQRSQGPVTGGCDPSFLLEDDYFAPQTPFAPPQVVPSQAALAPPQVVVWRITGRLPAPAKLSDLPGITWKTHKLRVSPNSSLNLTTTPFKVLNGQAYDLKFLSADKRHPTRQHVLAAFSSMGFKPFILAATKKNARIPGRPSVSMTEWIAVAQWIKPSDMILDDKPFHFEELKEVFE